MDSEHVVCYIRSATAQPRNRATAQPRRRAAGIFIAPSPLDSSDWRKSRLTAKCVAWTTHRSAAVFGHGNVRVAECNGSAERSSRSTLLRPRTGAPRISRLSRRLLSQSWNGAAMNSPLDQIDDWVSRAKQCGWCVTKLARVCGVSVRTLERHFLDMHGRTPEAWLAELRWRQALELVREGSPVKETASRLGYHQASAFSREFKRRFGQSPVKFSKSSVIKPLPPQIGA